ncbi:MAG: hypothetical protein ISR83_01985 [Candidatus Marinimicrobia bacterium]|nr:hypothetical protein [Candidatus Neomarinimicrobiota bacterium]
MNMTIKGILRRNDGSPFIEGADGVKYFTDHRLWSGYLDHWDGQPVFARLLSECDYEKKQPIVIMWPDKPVPTKPYVEIYYAQRLVKYLTSTLGHSAINVNGEIFNFSHLMNENEIITEEEFFFRPALGEFAPSPNNGKYEITSNGTPYYDKFGRNFMRTIHVLRIEGIDVEKLGNIYKHQLDVIRSTPPKPKEPEAYSGFNMFTRSCSTIIRDGLVEYGFSQIKGIFPRDLYISAAYHLLKEDSLKVEQIIMPQLVVPEADLSAMSPILNPKNYIRNRLITKKTL